MSILAGMGVALQSRLNGELGLELAHGSLAALISFASGLVILGVALGSSAHARRGLREVLGRVRHGDLPWWSIIGGLGGGMLVLTQGLVAGSTQMTLWYADNSGQDQAFDNRNPLPLSSDDSFHISGSYIAQ